MPPGYRSRATKQLSSLWRLPDVPGWLMPLLRPGQWAPASRAAGVPPPAAAVAAWHSRVLSHHAASTSTPPAAPWTPQPSAQQQGRPRPRAARQRAYPQEAAAKQPGLRTIRGVGPAYEALLRKKDISSVQALQELLHLTFHGNKEELEHFLTVSVGCPGV